MSDDGGQHYFTVQLEQKFNDIFNVKEVKNYEHRINDIRSIRHGKIDQPTQHESRGNALDSNGAKTTPF